MFTLILLLALVLSGATPAWAQLAYTYHVLDLPDPDGPQQRRLSLRGVTPDNYLFVEGRLVNWQVSPDRTQITLLLCMLPDFTREPTAVRQGPLFEGLNATRTFVGNDDGRLADNIRRLVGIVRYPEGCELFRYPGSVNTWLRGVSSEGHQVGSFQMPLPANLLRFGGFVRKVDGTLLALNGLGADSPTFPEDIKGERVVGYALTQVNATTGAYVYTAFICEQYTQCLPIKDPNGRDLWIPALNNTGQAVAMTASGQHVTGGQPWLIDLATTTFYAIPPPVVPGFTVISQAVLGINDHGWIVGHYTVREDGCVVTTTSQCDQFHQFLAIPNAPLPDPGTRPKKARWEHLRDWLHAKRERLQDWREAHRDPDDTRWQPALKEGKAVLMRGEEVLGD